MPESEIIDTPTDEKQIESSEAAIEREEDEAFDQLDLAKDLSDEPTEDETKSEPASERDERGRLKSESTDESDSDEESAAEESDTDDAELRKARANLVLEGDHTESELDAMSDEQKIRLAKRAVENRAKYTRVTQELADLKRLGEQETAGTTKDSENADPFDVLKTVEPHLDKLRAELGEEYAEPIAEIAKALSEGIGKRVAQNEEAMRVLQNVELHREYKSALADHTEKWDLNDDVRLKQVQDHMKKIDNPSVYEDMGSLMNAACLQLFAEERIREVESNLSTEHKHRKAGQPTPPGKRSSKPELTPEDEEDQLIDAILDKDEDRYARLDRKFGSGVRRKSASELMAKGMR